MSNLVSQDNLSIVVNDIFLPASTDLIDAMIAEYRVRRERIERVSHLMADENCAGVAGYFLEAQSNEHNRINPARLFEAEPAIKVLNAEYWDKALRKTDVLSVMPQERVYQWHDQIKKRETPDFEESIVRESIIDLMNKRLQFFAERVDGVFRALSGDHVTNRPEGFFKRMIINYVMDPKWETFNYDRVGYINDLRYVINKLLGRPDIQYGHSNALVGGLRYFYGDWVDVDGGAFRIKLYKKGTIHIEVHPDLAWQLNQILATIHPMAIPPQFRSKTPKKEKEYQPVQDILPIEVTKILSDLRIKGDAYTTQVDYFGIDHDKHLKAKVIEVLMHLGAERDGSTFYFNYDVVRALRHVCISGRLPEQKSHQFYPTPEKLAKIAVNLADIQQGHSVLEPSAGHGALYEAMPAKCEVTLVELSELNCEILRAKIDDAANVVQADFIEWAKNTDQHFDRIVMNPPYSEGRAERHTKMAAQLLKDYGVLVAILPASFKDKKFLPGFNHTYSDIYKNEFEDTSVSVVILTATKGETA